jgi:hypothetical protein
MKNKLIFSGSIILAFSLLLAGCDFPGATTPTLDAVSQQATVDVVVTQVLQTMAVNLTGTALAMPTSTITTTPEPPTATATLLPTATRWIPTATRTRVPMTRTPTGTATPSDYVCQLISTSPTDGTKININSDFDATWKVKNIGTRAWELGYVDLKYVSGTKFQTHADVFDVTSAVAPGGELTLVVDMRTPASTGKYTAAWVLVMEGRTLCNLPMNIEATNP